MDASHRCAPIEPRGRRHVPPTIVGNPSTEGGMMRLPGFPVSPSISTTQTLGTQQHLKGPDGFRPSGAEPAEHLSDDPRQAALRHLLRHPPSQWIPQQRHSGSATTQKIPISSHRTQRSRRMRPRARARHAQFGETDSAMHRLRTVAELPFSPFAHRLENGDEPLPAGRERILHPRRNLAEIVA